MNSLQPLIEKLFLTAHKYPDKVAIITPIVTLTYKQLWNRISNIARHLNRLGASRRNRIVVTPPVGVSWIASYFAVHAIGAVVIPNAAEVDYESDFIFSLGDFTLSSVNPSTTDNTERCYYPTCFINDPADILFTSGTTGIPKAAVLTHRNIASAAENTSQFLMMREDHVEVVHLPLHLSFGLGRVRCMAHIGHTLVLSTGKHPGIIAKTIATHEATGFATVPAIIELLLLLPKEQLRPLKNLHYIELGSAPMRRQTKEKLMQLLPDTRICHHYGSTEASRSAFIEYHRDAVKLDSIGKPSPNVEMRIQDGEILVRGDMVMKEYVNRLDLTQSAIRDGWFYTGDLGYKDEDGYFYLTGRKDNIINTVGRKVHAEEVEAALNSFPGIRESACVGVPDFLLGNQIKAFFVSEDPIDMPALIHHLRFRLAEYKIPTLWQTVESIPKTESGKIQRHLL